MLLIVLAVVAVGAIVFASAKASLTTDSEAIAKIGMPLGGGKVESVSVVTGPHAQPVPITVTGGLIYPRHRIAANEKLSIQVVVKRPGWMSWFAGSKQHLSLALTTPAASLHSHYITVAHNAALKLRFKNPGVETFSYGSAGHLRRRVLAKARTVVTVPYTGEAGSIFVAAAPRRWENASQTQVSWFPAGSSASAVASPAPGSQIKPGTMIRLNFSKPVSKALGSHRPVLTPATPGHWRTLTSHSIEFVPEGIGYGLGAKVTIAMPNGVRLVGGQQSAGSDGAWTVPGGSIVRLQQLLALTGYLPLKFNYAGGAGVGLSAAAQENAAVDPPKGTFSWRYGNTPGALKSFWKVGASGVMMQGALMAFETDHGLTADGQPGPVVWKTLIQSVLAGKHSTFGYTFVSVSVASQSLTLWHSGKTVISGTAVNTGIPSAPTATGTYPVYEHLTSTTMSGTNPDGSHYSDPGIPWVSYFNGGDALHGFTRASYGSPQSLGCVEMPFSVAGQVYPYTPIGTLVDVA
ncbi:MAG TPA: L,D-transpeptidase family protein [Solirubrobacteraceae bacterium]|nr:L,D-transpeptidase family protein [Solirubrobacteraceae bacterium]